MSFKVLIKKRTELTKPEIMKYECYSEITEKEYKEEIKEDPYDVDCYLIVYHKDKVYSVESDYFEPEDVSFNRNLGWVSGAIEDAYKFGLKEGKQGKKV